MKPQELSDEEGSFITEYGDRIILEIIKGMSLEELREFDIYKAKDMTHYCWIQGLWLTAEKFLISQRFNPPREVSESELINDMMLHNNGERFRVFYVLKYPENVERIKLIY